MTRGSCTGGARLTGALDWAREHRADLNELEREFLDASRAAAEQEVTDARRRVAQEARTSRRLRGLLAGLAGVLVLALVAGGLALTLRGRAERQALVADSRHLGAQALLEDTLDRSLLLARQAVALDDSLETRGDLLAALLRSPAATAILHGNLDGISALDLSTDGRLLAVGDTHGRVAIFDVRTRKALGGEFHAQSQITDLEFSPDGSLLALCTTEPGEAVHVVDVPAVRLRRDLPTAHEVTGVEFSTNGRTLTTLSTMAFGTAGATFLTRWDVASGRRLKGPARVSSHGGDTLLASPDGTRLVIVDGTEVIVEAAGSFRRLHRFPHGLNQPQIFVAALSRADGRTLALGSTEGWVEFLDLSTGRRWRATGRHDGVVQSIQFSRDGKMLATGGDDRTVKVWEVASRQLRETFQGHEARVLGLQFSVDGHTLYSSGSKSVIAWDLEGESRLGRPFSFFPGAPPALAISPDGAVVAIPDIRKPDQLTLRSTRSPAKTQRPLAPGIGPISAIVFSPDGKHLAVGGDRTPAPVLLDVAKGTITRRMTGGHEGGVAAIRFDPDGHRLVTGGSDASHDQRAIVWDIDTGKPIANLPQPGPEPVSVAWSPDGNTVATGGGQGKVILWRAADGTKLATLPVDKLYVSSMAFSPDNSMLAATGLDNRAITLWDVATHKLVGRLPHPAIINTVAFDPRGKRLATTSFDDKVRLWDLASRHQIGPALPGPEHQATGSCDFCFNVVEFDPSGNQLIVLYQSGAGIVWDVDPESWKARACAVAGRVLTQEEWRELLPGRSYQPACR